MVHNHTKGPIGNHKLILEVIRAAHQDLILDKVAPDFATSEANLDPVFLILFRFFKAWRLRWVEGVDLEARLHRLRALLGQNPRIGASSVKYCSHFLRLARTDVQLADIGQVLRICEGLLDLDIGELAQLDCLFELRWVVQIQRLGHRLNLGLVLMPVFGVRFCVGLSESLRKEASLLLFEWNSNDSVLSHIEHTFDEVVI